MPFGSLDLARRSAMYLSIRKAFSGFRSLSVDASPSADHDVLPTWRLSTSKTEEPFSTGCRTRAKPSHTRASSDSGISSLGNCTPNYFHILPPLPEATPHNNSQLNTETLLQALLKENKILRNENTYLKLEAHVREEELAEFRSEYYVKRFNATVRKHILGSTPERRVICDHKVLPSQLFRPPPNLRRPAESRMGETDSGEGATTGAIQPDAVFELSSKTFPTASVAKTNDCPEAMTCRTTRGIKDANDVARTPRAHKVHEKSKAVGLHSDGSSISILGHEERKVDDKQFKNGSTTLAPTTAGRIQSLSVGPHSRSTSDTPVSFCHSPRRNLTPLASEIFKDEVKDSLSRGKRSPIKKLRSLLNEVDVNRSGPRLGSYSAKSTECSGTFTKALEKRKAILLERSPLDSAIDVHNVRRNGTVDTHPPRPMLETSTTCSAGDSEVLSAEKALLSLERICAGFSSGSLGSLECTPEPSSVNDPLLDVPSLFVLDATVEAENVLSVRSRASLRPESPSFSCLSVKSSTPLVSGSRPSIISAPFRPATKSSLKTRLNSTTRTSGKSTAPLRSTNVKGAVSSSPSPRKKTICKHTSPLRIAKKGKGNASARSSPVRV